MENKTATVLQINTKTKVILKSNHLEFKNINRNKEYIFTEKKVTLLYSLEYTVT